MVLLGFDGVVEDDVSVEVFGGRGWDACAMIKFEGGGRGGVRYRIWCNSMKLGIGYYLIGCKCAFDIRTPVLENEGNV